ncbi:unnamed protein product [Amoebophrya sp. A25]|nr:unnamed protein product [Amoebophrya sp. A25]|eukprot:GSA25T00006329001.1
MKLLCVPRPVENGPRLGVWRRHQDVTAGGLIDRTRNRSALFRTTRRYINNSGVSTALSTSSSSSKRHRHFSAASALSTPSAAQEEQELSSNAAKGTTVVNMLTRQLEQSSSARSPNTYNYSEVLEGLTVQEESSMEPVTRLPEEFRIKPMPSDGRLPLEVIPLHPPMRVTEDMMQETRVRRYEFKLAKDHAEAKRRHIFHWSVMLWRWCLVKALRRQELFSAAVHYITNRLVLLGPQDDRVLGSASSASTSASQEQTSAKEEVGAEHGNETSKASIEVLFSDSEARNMRLRAAMPVLGSLLVSIEERFNIELPFLPRIISTSNSSSISGDRDKNDKVPVSLGDINAVHAILGDSRVPQAERHQLAAAFHRHLEEDKGLNFVWQRMLKAQHAQATKRAGFGSHAEMLLADNCGWKTSHNDKEEFLHTLATRWGRWFCSDTGLDGASSGSAGTSIARDGNDAAKIESKVGADSSTWFPPKVDQNRLAYDLPMITNELCEDSRECQEALLVMDSDLEKLITFIGEVAGCSLKLTRADHESVTYKLIDPPRHMPYDRRAEYFNYNKAMCNKPRTICFHLGASLAPSVAGGSRALTTVSHVPVETDLNKEPLPWSAVWNVNAPEIHHLRTNTYVRILSLADLQAIVHELGHCFHFGLTAHKFEELSVMSEDAIEVPSSALEYLVRDRQFLQWVVTNTQVPHWRMVLEDLKKKRVEFASAAPAHEVSVSRWFRTLRVEHWDLARHAYLSTVLSGENGLQARAAAGGSSWAAASEFVRAAYITAHCGGRKQSTRTATSTTQHEGAGGHEESSRINNIKDEERQKIPTLNATQSSTRDAKAPATLPFHPLGIPEIRALFVHEYSPALSSLAFQINRWWRDDRKLPKTYLQSLTSTVSAVVSSPVVLAAYWLDMLGSSAGLRLFSENWYRAPNLIAMQNFAPYCFARVNAVQIATNEDYLMTFYREYWTHRQQSVPSTAQLDAYCKVFMDQDAQTHSSATTTRNVVNASEQDIESSRASSVRLDQAFDAGEADCFSLLEERTELDTDELTGLNTKAGCKGEDGQDGVEEDASQETS